MTISKADIAAMDNNKGVLPSGTSALWTSPRKPPRKIGIFQTTNLSALEAPLAKWKVFRKGVGWHWAFGGKDFSYWTLQALLCMHAVQAVSKRATLHSSKWWPSNSEFSVCAAGTSLESKDICKFWSLSCTPPVEPTINANSSTPVGENTSCFRSLLLAAGRSSAGWLGNCDLIELSGASVSSLAKLWASKEEPTICAISA